MTKEFIGVWKLTSWESRNDDKVTYRWGKDVMGYLIYHEDGHMAVSIMKSGRTPFDAKSPLDASDVEKQSIADTFIAYSGTFSVKENQVFHHVLTSSFPNWIGSDQKRWFEFKDNQLMLSTDPGLISENQQTEHLIWERVVSG